MAKLKDLKDLVQNVNLTEEQIAELLTIIIDMKKKNENIEKGKVVLPPELVSLLEKCTINRGEQLVCPLCGSTSVNKNGKKDGRQRYICKACVKTFGDTYGTLLYHSKLTVKQWIEFLTLTLYNSSLNRIKKDMGINLATAWYNRHKVCSLIMQLEGEQDSFPSIVEGDEFFIPLSFIGERNKAFFIEELKRMPRHHRNRVEKFEYIEQAGYEVAEVEDMDGFYDDETIPSNLSVSKELNGLDKEEKRKRGISNEQVCVITAVDKLQNAYLAPTCLGKIEPKHLEQHLSGKFAEDSILVTDSLRAYRTFANNNKIHLRQIPSGRHTSGPFNLGKVNSYHSKMTGFFDRYKEVGSKYLDHYLALFRWQEKGFNSRTADRVNMLLDMLTKGVPEKVKFQKLKHRCLICSKIRRFKFNMDKHGIDVKAYIREKKGLYYVSIVYVNSAGKRKDKSFPTKLPVKGNKKKAELMAKEILENFEIPVVDLYLQDASAIGDGKEIKKKRNIVLPKELIEQVALSDLTKEQVSGMLFADYLEKYLPIVKKRGIEETTYSSYAGNVKNPIGPHFRNKNITLGKLTSKDIQDFYDIQLERVTANTVIHYHAIIRLALCYARKMGYIKENPIEEVEKPEKNRFVGSFYQSSELNKIIELTRDTKLEFAVIFGGFYGLRRSEIVGLRWSAIDFENNVFYVNHTVTTPQVDGKKKIIAKDRAKTKSSIRALPLDESVKARLIEHKRKQEMYRKKFKRSYSKEWLDYIMVDELGGLILPDYITSAFSNLLKANGLRHIRFHDLRHTCASLLLNKGKQNGVTLKDIQVWLGHSDFSTTANIYSHLDANSKISSLDTLSGVVNI